jgi:predicted transcriptional regulator
VQKLCERLEAKIFVSADRRRRPNRYRACVDRESLTVRRLKAVADDLYSGSLTPLVSQLLKGGSFTPQEIETLRDEVERLSEETKRRPAPRKRKRGGAR